MFETGKDWIPLIAEPAVKRFLQAANFVLEEEIWKGIPQINRTAVEAAAAAEGLGLSIEELRLLFERSLMDGEKGIMDEIEAEDEAEDEF